MARDHTGDRLDAVVAVADPDADTIADAKALAPARMVDVDVPLEIAQYAEGQRFIAFFLLNEVQDGEKKVPQYLCVSFGIGFSGSVLPRLSTYSASSSMHVESPGMCPLPAGLFHSIFLRFGQSSFYDFSSLQIKLDGFAIPADVSLKFALQILVELMEQLGVGKLFIF